MRKLIFYSILLKKFLLFLLYPFFDGDNRFCSWIKLKIENYLVFQPSKLRAKRIRRDLLKKIIPQRFLNSDGVKLYAWFIKPKDNNPVFLHFHGQCESILTHQDIAAYCVEKGFGLFLLSYRGHYKTWGKPSEKGIYTDAKDAICRLKNLGVDKDKIVLWGHSLGSAVAVETALHNDVAGLILQSPIKELKSAAIDVAQFYFSRLHLASLNPLIERLINNVNFIQRFDNISKIKDINCPILILHSKTDRIAPYMDSEVLYNQSKNAKLHIADFGTHWKSEWCFEQIFEFVSSLGYNNSVK